MCLQTPPTKQHFFSWGVRLSISNKFVPREGLIFSLIKKGDREDPGNYRDITLLNLVGKLYSRVINTRLLIMSCMKGKEALD